MKEPARGRLFPGRGFEQTTGQAVPVVVPAVLPVLPLVPLQVPLLAHPVAADRPVHPARRLRHVPVRPLRRVLVRPLRAPVFPAARNLAPRKS
jgi:hypothetical protein